VLYRYIYCFDLTERRISRDFSESVFSVGYSDTNSPNDVILLGTAFSISDVFVVTASHVLHDDSGKALASSFFISSAVLKNGELIQMVNPREIDQLFNDVESDWSILRIKNTSIRFSNWLPICPVKSLPNVPAEHVQLKFYYAPIGQFLVNGMDNMVIWRDDYKTILQYNLERTKIYCDGGLYRGSCGAPYINKQGFVVAMHLSSINEGVNWSNVKYTKKRKFDQLEKVIAQSVTDMNAVHASIREGLVLVNVASFMEHIQK